MVAVRLEMLCVEAGLCLRHRTVEPRCGRLEEVRRGPRAATPRGLAACDGDADNEGDHILVLETARSEVVVV